MVEQSNAKIQVKPLPQISTRAHQFADRVGQLSNELDEAASRILGKPLVDANPIGQDSPEPGCELEAVQMSIARLEDQLISLENRLSVFLGEI
jgi:hypothetical protein